jgi:hypothetical protein
VAVKYDVDKNQYVITCNGEQARIMARALELFARCSIGQFNDTLEPCRLRTEVPAELILKLREHTEAMERLWQVFRQGNPTRGVSDGDVAWDINQVLRHRLSWDSVGNPPKRTSEMFGVYFDEPTPISGKAPIKIHCAYCTPAKEVKEPNLFEGDAQLQPPYYAPIQVLKMNAYRDGGTIALTIILNTKETQVFQDRRIRTETRGVWFDRYPSHEDAVPVPAELAAQLDEYLKLH